MKNRDATQTGADGAEKAELRPAYDARFRAAQQIARAVHNSYASSGELHDIDESGRILSKMESAPAEQEEEPAQEAQAPQEQPQEAPEAPEQPQAETKPQEPAKQAQAPAQEQQQDVEYVTVVVDGERRQVPKASIIDAGIRTFQKESAADRRLAEAQRLFRQAQDAARAAQTQQYAPADDNQLPQFNWDAGAQNQAIPDAGTLLSAVDQRLDTELDKRLYLRDAEKAAERFQQDFPEIANDPVLATYVVRLEDERLRSVAAGGMPLGDPWKAYQAHAAAARQWGEARGLFRQEKVSSAPAKTDLKRQIQQVPSANVRAPAPQPEKPRTNSDVIADMARRRGQRI